MLRYRSVAVSLALVVAVAVSVMLSATLSVARAMLLSSHDLRVMALVCALAAVVSLVVALLVGRRVVAGSRALAVAARALGDSGGFTRPGRPLTAELAEIAEELAAAGAKLAASRERERALEAPRHELVAWISHDLRTPRSRRPADGGYSGAVHHRWLRRDFSRGVGGGQQGIQDADAVPLIVAAQLAEPESQDQGR